MNILRLTARCARINRYQSAVMLALSVLYSFFFEVQGLSLILCVSLPASVMYMDFHAGFHLLAALPVRRRDLVLSRYLYGLLCVVLFLLVSLISSLMGLRQASTLSAGFSFFCTLLAVAIQLTVHFSLMRYSNVVLLLPTIVLCAAVIVFEMIAPWRSGLLSAAPFWFGAGLILYGLFCLLCVKILSRKQL